MLGLTLTEQVAEHEVFAVLRVGRASEKLVTVPFLETAKPWDGVFLNA